MPSFLRRSYNTVWIFMGLYVVAAMLRVGGDGAYVVDALKLSPDAIRNGHEFWRLATYAFLSSDWVDLFMKLLLMFLLAVPVEVVWGTRRFLCLLAATIIGGGACAVLMGQELVGTWAPPMALMMVYGLLFPENMMSLFLIFPMRVKTFAMIITGLFVAGCVTQGPEGWAMLLGLACGMAYYLAAGYVPWMLRARRAVAATATRPQETIAQLSSARKMERVRQIYAAVKAGQPLNDVDSEFVSLLGKEADAGQGLCSPLSFCMDNTICPPCSQIGLCLRRYLETHQPPAAAEPTRGAETA